MAYFSLFLSLFYLMSCPLLAIVNIVEFDDIYVFYPILQGLAYTLYLLKDFTYDCMGNQVENTINIQDRKLDNYFNIFNVLYILFLLGLSYITMNTIILSFVLYPLGLKVSVIDALYIKETNCKKLTELGELQREKQLIGEIREGEQ